MATLNHLAPSGRFLLAATYTGIWFALGAGIGRLGRRT
ncbi:hypothetical protein QF027_001390 [Streptomyces canus]|nr:hypothetical protein [Streptomyces canus]